MDQQRLQGVLVAVTSSAYGSFKDRQTGEVVPGGETLWAWVSESFEATPVAVKFSAMERPTWDSLREVGQGVHVALVVELRAKGQTIERRFVGMVPVQGDPAENSKVKAKV